MNLIICDNCGNAMEVVDVVECKSYPASIRVKPCEWCLEMQAMEDARGGDGGKV